MANNCMAHALIDTGSEVCVTTKRFTENLGLKLHQWRNGGHLVGVTQHELRVLGAVYLEINVGQRVVTHLFIVVPDEYLDTDLLIGADLLSIAPLTWDYSKRMVTWNHCIYPLRYLKPRPSNKRIRHVKLITNGYTKEANVKADVSRPGQVRIKKKVVLQATTANIVPVNVKEEPDTLLEFTSKVADCPTSSALCLRVNEEQEVFLPFINNTRARKTLKIGTLLGEYRVIKEDDVSDAVGQCRTTKIKNDLIPPSISENHQHVGTREERLQQVFSRQDYSHLSEDQQQELQEMLGNNQSVFILDDKELGKFEGIQAHINVSDPQPVRSPMYRYPEKAKEVIAGMLDEMEEKGIIEPSNAAWLSPIVLVRKPDNTQRMCLDYRKVNTHLQVDIHPLPRLEEMVETAAGNQYYASLDMKDAYYQIELDEGSRDLTTFSDGISLYRFKRLPFGLSVSPAIFSRVMGNILAPLSKKGWVKNYLDDIVVWAPNFPLLLKRLDELFKLFKEKGVKLNLKKCQIGQKEIKFLGHIISQDGCRPCPDNISAIKSMKSPTNVKEVRRFLGMCGFYRKHIDGYAKIAVPMTNLLKEKEPFQWTDACQASFEQLKQALISAPILIKAQMTRPFELHTDASLEHVGGVLMQKRDGQLKPVGYFSKKLKPVEQRYSTTDREALAIILACRRFHHFLWGVPFTIHTDHQPLVSVFKRKTKCPRMSRWAVELQDYRFKIEYRPGRSNQVADQLSRPVRAIFHQGRDDYLGLSKEEFREKQLAEPRWAELIAFLEGGQLPRKKFPRALVQQFLIHDGLLYLSADRVDDSVSLKLVVPKELVKSALKFGHEAMAGHLGIRKSIDSCEEVFYWPSLRGDVRKHVLACLMCQRHKSSAALQQPYRELPPVSKPLDRLGVDLTDMASGAHGYRYVLTIIDHYSRFVRFYAMRSKTSDEVSRNFTCYLQDYGVPACVILDNGAEFTSTQFRTLLVEHNIHAGYITPYHPQGNSVTERMHRTMKTVLNTMCKGHPYQWPKYLGETQRVLNTAIHTTIGEQPHYAFFSRRAHRQVPGVRPPFSEEPDEGALAKAHEIIRATQTEMARKYLSFANRKRKNQAVNVSDLVWVRSEGVIPNSSRKLNPKWSGPYKVVEKHHSGATYKLENLLNGQTLSRSVDKLKPYIGCEEQWLLELEKSEDYIDIAEESPIRGARPRLPPARLIEEM